MQVSSLQSICRNCGQKHEINTYPNINVGETPSLKDKVKDGSLFTWECPHCGQINLIKYQSLYHDPQGKIMVWLIPDDTVSPAEMQVIRQHLDAIKASITSDSNVLEGYSLRLVDNVGDLIEKILIHDAGLDDVVVEMCKYVTKMELSEKASAEDLQKLINARFKFYKMEGSDNDITFTYPLNGEMIGVNVGFNVYEDCLGIVNRNPATKPEAGFVKVDSEWLSTKIR